MRKFLAATVMALACGAAGHAASLATNRFDLVCDDTVTTMDVPKTGSQKIITHEPSRVSLDLSSGRACILEKNGECKNPYSPKITDDQITLQEMDDPIKPGELVVMNLSNWISRTTGQHHWLLTFKNREGEVSFLESREGVCHKAPFTPLPARVF